MCSTLFSSAGRFSRRRRTTIAGPRPDDVLVRLDDHPAGAATPVRLGGAALRRLLRHPGVHGAIGDDPRGPLERAHAVAARVGLEFVPLHSSPYLGGGPDWVSSGSCDCTIIAVGVDALSDLAELIPPTVATSVIGQLRAPRELAA